MAAKRSKRSGIQVVPATAERWADVEKLFGPRGACAGCWCMFFKQTGPEFKAGRGTKNRKALERLVKSGAVPGLLAYDGAEPVGWCAVEPRERYGRIARSRRLVPEGTPDAWSVPCFFVARTHRGRGLTVELLRAAATHAQAQGAPRIEGYPIVPRTRLADAWAYHGLVSAFEAAGFREEAQPSPSRRIMRRQLAKPAPTRKRRQS